MVPSGAGILPSPMPCVLSAALAPFPTDGAIGNGPFETRSGEEPRFGVPFDPETTGRAAPDRGAYEIPGMCLTEYEAPENLMEPKRADYRLTVGSGDF